MKPDSSTRLGTIFGRLLEPLLFLAAALIVTGHVVNRLTSPRPLNPLWNRVSTFAASQFGGHYVATGIGIFAICLLAFGILTSLRGPAARSATGSLCIALSALPMALVAIFPIFVPSEFRTSNAGEVEVPIAVISSNHIHNVSSAIAFTLFLTGLLLTSIQYLREPSFRRLGQLGILLVPVDAAFLGMAYGGTTYNGSWQRGAFLLPFLWMAFATRRLRRR